MELKNKILLIEQDSKLLLEICKTLNESGYEITDTLPSVFNAPKSIDLRKPDIIIIDAVITEPLVNFISKYINLPLIIISEQYEKQIYRYSGKIQILGIIKKPFFLYNIKIPIVIAFNKLRCTNIYNQI